MTDKSVVVRSICHIPIEFQKGDVSFAQLLKVSGYLGISNAVSVDDVANYLRLNPHLLASWIQWSEDKRTSGPFIEKTGPFFEVGEVTGKGTYANVRKFDGLVEACSNFIIDELRACERAP